MSNEEQQQANAQQMTEQEVIVESKKQGETLSPGQQLIVARENLGLTQQQVADRLHLRLSSVQAVEQDALEEGVSVTFNKGYVRLYAKLVQLEIQPLLDAYDEIHIQDNKPAKLQSFSRRVTREASDHRWNMVTVVVVILVLGSVVGWWVQQSDSFKDSQAFVAETFENLFSEKEVNTETDAIDNNTSTEPDVIEEPEFEEVKLDSGPQVPDEQVQDIIESNTDDIITSVNEVVDELPADEVSDIPNELLDTIDDTQDQVEDTIDDIVEEDSLPRNSADIIEGIFTEEGYRVNSDGTVNLVFTFKDDCWVSVKDKDGETMAYGVKKKGRVMEVSGEPPVRVILGAPQNVEINFGGLQVDMSVHPAGRSANFKLPVGSE